MKKKIINLLLLSVFTSISILNFSLGRPAFVQAINMQEPGIVRLEGLVKEVLTSYTICNRAYQLSVIFEVEKVVSPGRSLTNKVSVGQQLTLVIESTLENELKNRKIVPVEGQRISIMAKEKICQDPYLSAYMVLKLDLI